MLLRASPSKDGKMVVFSVLGAKPVGVYPAIARVLANTLLACADDVDRAK